MSSIPVIETTSTGNIYNSTTLTVTKPTGIVANDVLIAICYNNASTTAVQFSSTSTGWSRFAQQGWVWLNVGCAVAMFSRVATGDANDASFVLNIADTVRATHCKYYRISGVDVNDIWGASTSRVYTSAVSSFQANSVTSPVDNSLCLAAGVQYGGQYTCSTLSGFPPWVTDEFYNSGPAGGTAGAIATQGLATAGSTTNCLWSDGSNPSSYAATITATLNPSPFKRRIFIS